MTAVVFPRPASTVVVLRPRGESYEVLLVRRNDRVAFMAGAFVFPGGRVDDGDRTGEGLPESTLARRFSDLGAAEEDAYRRAAARELQEEAAVTVDPISMVSRRMPSSRAESAASS